MPRYTLTIPRWRPPLANTWRGRHWTVAARLRKQTTKLLVAYAKQQRIPAATGRRRASLLVRLKPRMQRSDADSFDKLLLDALTRAGLLLDDSARGLEGRLEVSFERGTAEDWGSTITLEDVEE